MPKIPLYNQGQGQTVEMARGGLGPRASSAAFEAPGRALASFAKSVGDVAFQFGMAEKQKQVKDKDAEYSEKIMRYMNDIENSPDYTTASDAKTAAQLYRQNLFNEIDGLDMTSAQKNELRQSASKSISLLSLQAEQKAHNRGLQESGRNTVDLINSKITMMNGLAVDDPRINIIRDEIEKYRKDAETGGYLGYLPAAFQTKQGTDDEVISRLATGILSDENITEKQVDSYLSRLGITYREGTISDENYRANRAILLAKKAAIKSLSDIAGNEETRKAQIIRDDILFNDATTYSQLVTLREDIEGSRNKFSKVPKEDRPTLLAAVNAEITRRKTAEINTLKQRVEVGADSIARTGDIPAGTSQAIAKIMEMDAVEGEKISRTVKAAKIASGYVSNMELASTESWNANIEELEARMNKAKAKANAVGSTDAEVAEAASLMDAYKFATKLRSERNAAIKENPRKYYNEQIQKITGVSGQAEGAGYVNWVRSTGLVREEDITIFTKEEAENLIERFKGLSPVGKRAEYDRIKAEVPGVSQRILMQSFKKSGISTVDNLLMVMSNNPIAGDLNAAILMDDKDIKAMIADSDIEKNIAAAVATEMTDFNRSILGSQMEVDSFMSRASMGAEGSFGGRASFVNDTNKAVLKLARYYVGTQGMSASDAAAKAAQVHRSQFHYSELNGQILRVPTDQYSQGDADKIASGLAESLQALTVDQLQQQNGASEAQRLIRTTIYLNKLKRTGSWISTPDSRGAYMIDEFGVPVLDKDGKRITVQFNDVFLGAGTGISDVGGPAA